MAKQFSSRAERIAYGKEYAEKHPANRITNALQGKRGQFGVTLVTATIPTMRKTANPFIDRVVKVTTTANAHIGVSYESKVTNRLPDGADPYQVSKASGQTYYNEFLNVSDKNPDQFYLRVGYTHASSAVSEFYVDGRPATADEVQQIKTFCPAPKPCQKQLNAGVTEEVTWRTFKVENVVEIRQGDTILYHE